MNCYICLEKCKKKLKNCECIGNISYVHNECLYQMVAITYDNKCRFCYKKYLLNNEENFIIFYIRFKKYYFKKIIYLFMLFYFIYYVIVN